VTRFDSHSQRSEESERRNIEQKEIDGGEIDLREEEFFQSKSPVSRKKTVKMKGNRPDETTFLGKLLGLKGG